MMVHIVEGVAALVIILAAVDGWRRGLLIKLFGLLRLVIMIVLTVLLTPIMIQVIPLEPGLREGISVLSALVLSVVLVAVAAKVLHAVNHIPVLNTLNRLGGAVVGMIMGVMAVWVVLVVLSTLTDIEWCANVVSYVNASPILSRLIHFNPAKLLLNLNK